MRISRTPSSIRDAPVKRTEPSGAISTLASSGAGSAPSSPNVNAYATTFPCGAVAGRSTSSKRASRRELAARWSRAEASPGPRIACSPIAVTL
jgi:hypothetical protein